MLTVCFIKMNLWSTIDLSRVVILANRHSIARVPFALSVRGERGKRESENDIIWIGTWGKVVRISKLQCWTIPPGYQNNGSETTPQITTINRNRTWKWIPSIGGCHVIAYDHSLNIPCFSSTWFSRILWEDDTGEVEIIIKTASEINPTIQTWSDLVVVHYSEWASFLFSFLVI